jgi:septal ring-binding cell division protein DamX
MARRAIAGAAFTGLAAFAAACGTSSPSAGPATTAPAAPTSASTAAASTPAASPSPATSPAASPAVAAGAAAACPTRSLGVKIGVSQGTAGSIYTVIDFTNIGNVTCTLYGYPGVSLAGGKPVTQIGLAATRSTATAKTLVTLKPGAVANALLQIVDAGNYSPATCGPTAADYLQIYPPNQTTPIYLAFKSQACSKKVHILSVSVVMPGSGSSA